MCNVCFVLHRMPNGVAGGMMQPGGPPQRPPMQPGNPNINLVTALTQPGPNKVFSHFVESIRKLSTIINH